MVRGIRALYRTVRDPEFRGLVTLVLGLFAAGTIFYSLEEGWSLLDALYFSVSTLLTVGFGDLLPTTDLSKAFTTVYIVIGVGVLVTFVSAVGRGAVRERVGPHRPGGAAAAERD